MNPKVVATSFIKQYYAVFSTTPNELYKFYSSDSQFTHCENNQIGKSVSGSEEIREEVAQLNLQGAQLDLSNGFVDVQPRGEDSLVVLTGHYTQPFYSASVPFIQTFYLTKSPGGYFFVSNSVFRLLSSSAATTVDSSSSTAEGVLAASDSDAAAAAVSESALEEAASQNVDTLTQEQAELDSEIEHEAGVDALVGEPTPPTSSSSSAVDLTYHTAPAVVVEPPAVPAAAPVSVPVSAPVSAPSSAMSSSVAAAAVAGQSSKSYSDIVRKLTEAKTISSSGHIPSAGKPAVSSSAPPAVAPAAAAAAPSGGAVSRPPSEATKVSSSSIYVNHLHEDATQSDLQRVFSSFGPIASVDHVSGRSYAFVKFESPQSVRMTLDHKEPIEIAGKVVRVEERNARASNGNGDADKGGRGAGRDRTRPRDPNSTRAPNFNRERERDGRPPFTGERRRTGGRGAGRGQGNAAADSEEK